MKLPNIRICFAFLTFLVCFNSYARIGLADWEAITPLGHKINNFGSVSLFLSDSTIEDLNKWFFYKGYVIGTYQIGNNQTGTEAYFTANEKNQEVKRFTDQGIWQRELEKNNLVPLLWTRWYKSDWTFYDDQLILFLVFEFFISIPLIIGYFVLVTRAIKKERLDHRKPYTRTVLLISGLILLHWISEVFPGSI